MNRVDSLLLFTVGVLLLILAMSIFAVFTPYPTFHYGEQSTYGYMTTYEEGYMFDTVWIRADYSSSNTDGYCVLKDSNLKDVLKSHIRSGDRVQLDTGKYIFGWCSEPVNSVSIIK